MKDYEAYKPDEAMATWYGGNIIDIFKHFPLFIKRYLINPLRVSREMKHRENFWFSLLIGAIYIASSSVLPLGFCLNCASILKEIYSDEIVVPVRTSLILGVVFSLMTILGFFAVAYLIASAKGLQKPKPKEVLAVFNVNTIGVSLLYLACFGLSFLSVYVALIVFLLSLFYFGIMCTISIEALTDAMVFGRQAFITGWAISIMQATLFFVFVALLYLIWCSFRVAGETVRDSLYILFRYLR